MIHVRRHFWTALVDDGQKVRVGVLHENREKEEEEEASLNEVMGPDESRCGLTPFYHRIAASQR